MGRGAGPPVGPDEPPAAGRRAGVELKSSAVDSNAAAAAAERGQVVRPMRSPWERGTTWRTSSRRALVHPSAAHPPSRARTARLRLRRICCAAAWLMRPCPVMARRSVLPARWMRSMVSGPALGPPRMLAPGSQFDCSPAADRRRPSAAAGGGCVRPQNGRRGGCRRCVLGGWSDRFHQHGRPAGLRCGRCGRRLVLVPSRPGLPPGRPDPRPGRSGRGRLSRFGRVRPGASKSGRRPPQTRIRPHTLTSAFAAVVAGGGRDDAAGPLLRPAGRSPLAAARLPRHPVMPAVQRRLKRNVLALENPPFAGAAKYTRFLAAARRTSVIAAARSTLPAHPARAAPPNRSSGCTQ